MGAAPITQDVRTEFLEKFPNVRYILQGKLAKWSVPTRNAAFGMTEACTGVIVPKPGNDISTVGHVLSNMELKVALYLLNYCMAVF